MKKTWIWALLPLVASSCASAAEEAVSQTDSVYLETESFVAEVGYDFELPSRLLEECSSFTLEEESGEAKPISSGVIPASELELGHSYSVTCLSYNGISRRIPLAVADSEAPHFASFVYGATLYGDSSVYLPAGEPVDLNDVFLAEDNSGSCSTSFRIYHNEVEEVTLSGENASTFTPDSGYYLCLATAFDSSGNACFLQKKVELTPSVDSLESSRGESDASLKAVGSRAYGLAMLPLGQEVQAEEEVALSFEVSYCRDGLDNPISLSLNREEFYSSQSSSSFGNGWKAFEKIKAAAMAAGTKLSTPYGEVALPEAGIALFAKGLSSGDVLLIRNVKIEKA